MEKQNIPNKELSEFDKYMISTVIDEEPNEKQTWIGICIGIGYLTILSSFVFYIFALFKPELLSDNFNIDLYGVIAQMIAGLIVLVSTCFIIGKQKLFKILKGFTLDNFGKSLIFVGISWIALMIVSNIEIALFGTNDVSTSNQDSLEIIVKEYKLLSFFFIVVMAPIVEEIIFRYFIFRGSQRVVKPKYAFIITVSSFVAVHYLSSISAGTLVEDLKSILEYVVPSFIMTYLYYKNKNLATPIMYHMAFNGLQWILMIISFSLPEINSTSSIIQCLIGG